jgi:segregation and condensation protein B
VSTDERPDSLAAQAASWVPPWERTRRPPDRAHQAAAAEPDISDSVDGPVPDDDEDRSAANLSDDDDDFDETFEGASPEGYDEGVPPELAPLPGEVDGAAAVDAPAELPGEEEPEPTDVGGVPEVPLPTPVEDVSGEALEQEHGLSMDAPVPLDGGDAGDVFDAAADDDVSEEDDVDLPITEVVPTPDANDSAARATSDVQLPDGERDAAGGAMGQASQGGGGAVGAADARTEDDDRAGTDPGPADQAARDAGPVGSDAVPAGQATGDARPAGPDAGPMADSELRAALEAILLVVDEPVAELQLAQIMEQPTERVAAMLEDISARYTAAGHGFDLRRAAGGWRLYTRPEYAPYVERFVLDGQSVRLTQASLETLAVVAYKQPVTRSRVSAIRGVNCDGVMRTLVTRGLIEECGIEGETGAYLYRTTPLFLEKLGLNSVDQLPPLAPFLPDDVEEVLDASG